MFYNKKAQGMSTQTIILLILGLIVLVALIWGFMTGFSGFKKIISPSNVDKIVDACATSCSFQNQYDFCSGERELRATEKNTKIKTSCYVLANLPKFKKYKIEECPSISCDLACEDIMIDSKSGDDTSTSGTYNLTSLTKDKSACFIQ